MVLGDDKPEVVHLSTFEFAFLWSEKQLIGVEGLEDFPGDPPMVCEGGGVNEDVIHVADGLIAIDEGGEDVSHHCLEGGRQVAQSEDVTISSPRYGQGPLGPADIRSATRLPSQPPGPPGVPLMIRG